jgi:hypothetical protein
MRSSSTATSVETAIEIRISTRMASTGLLSRKPFCAKTCATKNEAKAPDMNTSPWAKLIINRMP